MVCLRVWFPTVVHCLELMFAESWKRCLCNVCPTKHSTSSSSFIVPHKCDDFCGHFKSSYKCDFYFDFTEQVMMTQATIPSSPTHASTCSKLQSVDISYAKVSVCDNSSQGFYD